MNYNPLLLKWALAVCAAITALIGASAQAQAPGADLKTDVSLVTSPTLTQGEPIVLKYGVTNVSGSERYIGMKEDSSNWLSLSLVDAAGHTVIGHPVPTARQKDFDSDFGSLMGVFSTPGLITTHSTLEGYVVASQWFPVPAPGKYTLAVHVHLFYRVVPASTPADGEVDEQDFNFPLIVTKADSTRLQSTAQNLEKAVLQVGPLEPIAKRNMLIGALFSMPSAQASPSWQALLSDPSSSSWVLSEAVENLVRLKSPAAPDILMGMLLNPTMAQDKFVTSDVINGMARTYRDADPLLRQHIRMLYASNGRPLAEMLPAPGRAAGN